MSKRKKKTAFMWWGDWTVLWVAGGVVLAYFIFIPLEVHPLHWLFSLLGGIVGYGIGLFFDFGLPPVVRFSRQGSRRTTLKPDRKKEQKRIR